MACKRPLHHRFFRVREITRVNFSFLNSRILIFVVVIVVLLFFVIALLAKRICFCQANLLLAKQSLLIFLIKQNYFV